MNNKQSFIPTKRHLPLPHKASILIIPRTNNHDRMLRVKQVSLRTRARKLQKVTPRQRPEEAIEGCRVQTEVISMTSLQRKRHEKHFHRAKYFLRKINVYKK
jgi:hypothetical protein